MRVAESNAAAVARLDKYMGLADTGRRPGPIDKSVPEGAAESLWPHVSGSVASYLDTPPPDQQWLFDERFLATRGHLLTGIGGVSKTRMLYHLAIAGIVGHTQWGWSVARTGSAALFLLEDTCEGVHRTVSNTAQHSSLSARERKLIGERLRVYPLAGKNAKLLSLAPGLGLIETYCVRDLIETCKAIPDLVFVGLDPALGLTDGDESNPAHQRRLGELADRIAIELGVCVVLASHAAKALQTAEEVGSHTSRGSGAITDALRAEYVMRTMTAQEARRYGINDVETRKAHVQFVATKGNELPPEAFAPIWLRRGTGGVLFAADLQEADNAAARMGKREAEALDVLRDLTASGNVTVAAWGRECVARNVIPPGSASSIEKTIHRIKSTLLTNQLIESGMGRGVFHPKDPE